MKIKNQLLVPAVASAVAFACGSAGAADIGAASKAFRVTNQYLDSVASNSTATVSLPQLEIVPQSNGYEATGSTVQLEIKGASITTAATAAATCINTSGSASMDLAFNSISNNVITFNVTRNTAAKVAQTIGDTAAASIVTCTFAAGTINVLASSIAKNSAVTVNWNGTYASSTKFDYLVDPGSATGIGARTIGNSFEQFSALVSGQRDVLVPQTVMDSGTADSPLTATLLSTNEVRFYSSSTNPYNTAQAADSFVFASRDEGVTQTTNAGNASISGANKLTTNTRVTTIAGDFKFIDDDQNGCTSADLTAGAGKVIVKSSQSTAPTVGIDSACSALTITYTTPNSADVLTRVIFATEGADVSSSTVSTLTVGASSVKTRSASPYPLAANANFTPTTVFYDNNSVVLASKSHPAQKWTITTAASTTPTTALIPYLPYGPGISRVVYLTNNQTAKTLTVGFSAQLEDGTVCSTGNFSSVTVAPSAVGLLTGAIDAGLAKCGYDGSAAKKAAVTVRVLASTTSAAAATGGAGGWVVTSNYNVNGDRVNVLNSTN